MTSFTVNIWSSCHPKYRFQNHLGSDHFPLSELIFEAKRVPQFSPHKILQLLKIPLDNLKPP